MFKKKELQQPEGGVKIGSMIGSNPKVFHSYMLVETLFGRQLKCDPKVIASRPEIMVGYATKGGQYAYFGEKFEFAVHELVHCEDMHGLENPLNGGKAVKDSPLVQFWLEGRATFAERVVMGFKPKEFKVRLFSGESQMAENVLVANLETFRIRTPRRLIQYYVELKYASFHNALCRLADELGSAVLAFRITNEVPSSWKAIISPLKYYRPQLEKAKRRKRAAWALEKAYKTQDIRRILECASERWGM